MRSPRQGGEGRCHGCIPSAALDRLPWTRIPSHSVAPQKGRPACRCHFSGTAGGFGGGWGNRTASWPGPRSHSFRNPISPRTRKGRGKGEGRTPASFTHSPTPPQSAAIPAKIRSRAPRKCAFQRPCLPSIPSSRQTDTCCPDVPPDAPAAQQARYLGVTSAPGSKQTATQFLY